MIELARCNRPASQQQQQHNNQQARRRVELRRSARRPFSLRASGLNVTNSLEAAADEADGRNQQQQQQRRRRRQQHLPAERSKRAKKRRESECEKYRSHISDYIRDLLLPRELRGFLNHERDI